MWSLELGDRLGDLVTGGGVSARIEPLRTASDKKAEAGDGALISHPAVISRGRRRLLERQIVASIDSFDELSFGAITADPLEPGSKVIVSFLAPRSLTAAHEGIRCRFAAVVVSSRANASKGARFALRLEWERPLSQMVAKAVVTRNIRLGVALFSLLGGAAWYTSGRYDDFCFG